MNQNLSAFDAVILDLNRIHEQGADANRPQRRVTNEDLDRWTAATGLTQDLVCDEIGIYLAHRFDNSDLTFEFCDEVANDTERQIGL